MAIFIKELVFGRIWATTQPHSSKPFINTIMNQPLSIADEVGVSGGDGEIVHGLGLVHKGDGLDHAVCAIGAADEVAGVELTGRYPFVGTGVEGVVGGGDDGFARYRQQLHHLVVMHNRRQDGVVDYCPSGFIVGFVANC